MQFKLVTITLFCFVFSLTEVHSQEKKVENNIDKVMSGARENNMIMPNDIVYQEGNIRYTLNKVKSFVLDSNIMVRNQSYMIIHKAGMASKNSTEILECVDLLSKACQDKDMGIVLYCSKSLRRYPREYFSVKAREYIKNALFQKSKSIPNIAQLIGYLNIQESIDKLQNIASSETENKKNKWYAHLALARMGNETSLNYCLGVYRSQTKNSELIENMIPDLLYTRQRAAYKEIIEILYSDEKGCVSGNPDNQRSIPCGYLVMEQLAPYIDGFPLETHASGAIKSDDYRAALEKLRVWFKNNNDYKIIDRGF